MFRSLGLKIKKSEDGLASIVVVGVLIVLLTVISLGFATIMQRTAQNSLNDQTAAAATYAAQSGINDLATYIRSNPTVKAEDCDDLIGTSSAKGPFYTSANLSGDRNSEYTCILLNQRPDSLFYQRIPSLESKVIKMTTDSTTGSVDKMLISWQSESEDKKENGERGNRETPPNTNNLPDAAAWSAADHIPMLRLTLYPVTTAAAINNIQAVSRTVFLYPAAETGSNETIDYSALTEGQIVAVGCRGANDDAPLFDNLARMDCNLAITGLADIPSIDYYYLRAMPIYSNIDFEIKAKDIDDRTVKFKGVQAVLDVTARVGPASKRLQARVDIGSNPTTPPAGPPPLIPSPNVGPDDTIPEHALRSANAICKRMLFESDPYPYVSFEGDAAACRNESIVDTPNAAITYFRINGIDDTASTPAPYTGVYYVGAGGTAPLTWRTEHATSCTGSRGTGAWPFPKTPPVMTWAGHVGTGSQNISPIHNVTHFDLRCNGPNSTTSTRTVTAWPPPTVSFSGSDTSYRAGETYTIRFTSANASNCTMTSTGNQPWSQNNYVGIQASGGSSPSGSQSFGTHWSDQSTKTYTATCVDPSGRTTGPVTWTVGIGGNTNIQAPSCSGAAEIYSNGDGFGEIRWNMSCPTVDPASGAYWVYTDAPCGLNPGRNIDSSLRNSNCAFIHGGTATYCMQARAEAPGWGTIYDSGMICREVWRQLRFVSFVGNQIWDQGPQRCDASVGPPYAGTWYCRNNRFDPNETHCPDYTHRFTMCGSYLRWSTAGGYGPVTCRASTSYGDFYPAGANLNGAPVHSFGWPDNPVGSVRLTCRDGKGEITTSGNTYP